MDVEEEEDDEVEEDDVEEQDRSQDRDARACAVEMHVDMSQEAFVRKFTGKPRPAFCASLRSRNAHGHGKMPNASNNTWSEHRALTLTVRTPSVWPHSLRKLEAGGG